MRWLTPFVSIGRALPDFFDQVCQHLDPKVGEYHDAMVTGPVNPDDTNQMIKL